MGRTHRYSEFRKTFPMNTNYQGQLRKGWIQFCEFIPGLYCHSTQVGVTCALIEEYRAMIEKKTITLLIYDFSSIPLSKVALTIGEKKERTNDAQKNSKHPNFIL